ncbi:unnamed protein product [Spirodela intermedia]|uniref:GPI ethanolamine phosphate transferase 2 C-terminal domain-containing protein n=1 Tax=Spirodela intermedia TaxID=51605 RepID=A0A7I8KWY1_SPIIN|nr:unnamed protein product [Spirodela intermedia]
MPSSMACTRLAAWTVAAVLLQILGLYLFMFAFFPVRPALSGLSGPESFLMPTCGSADIPERWNLPPHELRAMYKGMSRLPPFFDRLILMVVDGLPAEFILGKGETTATKIMADAMPYTHSLLSSGKALGYHALAATPTVTMPRLKAIVSGIVGGFLDVAFNFNTQEMLDDNLVDQFYHCGQKMVMLGDETWIRLFPGRFIRQDGVSSFYVKDTVEVDFNVSRHLESELAAKDWDLLILHYLGLDHVGHIGGRNSILMAPKLKEMDDVIRAAHTHAILQQNVDKRTLLVVVSDHGMTDNGNHGGSSYEETDSVALFVGLQPKSTDFKLQAYRTINQVDIAPTLAILFGLPIPKNSVGLLIREVVDQMTDVQRLRALEINSFQLLRLLQSYIPDVLCEDLCVGLNNAHNLGISPSTGSVKENFCHLFSNAVNFHNSWKLLNESEILNGDLPSITVDAYYEFLGAASDWLSTAATSNPATMLLAGISIMVFSCAIILGLLVRMLKEHRQKLYPSHGTVFNCSWNKDEAFVFLAILIHVFSLGSSSLVEEEQYTWHFLTSTLYLIFLFMRIQSFVGFSPKATMIVRGDNHSTQLPFCFSLSSLCKILKGTSFVCKDHQSLSFCSILSVLICMRVLRGWHQGGVNWIHLPDISKSLEEAGTSVIKTFRIASLVFLISLGFLALRSAKSRKVYLGVLVISHFMSFFLISLHILGYQNHSLLESSYDLSSFLLLYGSLILTLMISLLSPWFSPSCRQNISWETKFQMSSPTDERVVNYFLHSIRDPIYIIGVTYTSSWCLLQLFLQQPINAAPVLMLFIQILVSTIYFSHEESQYKPWVEVSALYFIGMTGHFGLGNSNTLATIDVAGAFNGIFGQSTVLAGIMMLIITYASPLLYLLSLVLYISLKTRKYLLGPKSVPLTCLLREMLVFPCLVPLALNSISLTSFTIILFAMRNHLFIWSVFSPKYLYVCAATVCVYVGLLVVAATISYICAVVFYKRRIIGPQAIADDT